MYSVYTAETVTGNIIGTLPCVIQSWGRPLGGQDAAQVTINPGTLTAATRDNFRLITTPWRSTLIIDWDGVIVCACPIVTREFDESNGSGVKITGGPLTTLLTRRKVHTWATPYNTEQIAYTGISLGQTAINLVGVATDGSKAGSSLPIVTPGGTETSTDATMARTYYGYELKDVGTELAALTASLNGPDIDFLPQWTDATRSRMQWVMRVGTLTQPVLQSPQAVLFNATVPKSPVQTIDVIEDASSLTTTEWANGAGSTVGTAMAMAQSTTLTGALFPLLEGQNDYKTVSDVPTLQNHAQADLTARQAVTEQWVLTVDAQASPTLGTYLLGDACRVLTSGHIWVPDGDHTMRIIGMSGDNTATVKLDLQ